MAQIARAIESGGKICVKFLTCNTKTYYTDNVEERRIIWDEAKNAANKQKHGISFETARFVFGDSERLWRLDRSEGNIQGEERWQSLGKADDVLFVVYTEHETVWTNETRIISARLANKAERRSYHGYYRIDNAGWSKAD